MSLISAGSISLDSNFKNGSNSRIKLLKRQGGKKWGKMKWKKVGNSSGRPDSAGKGVVGAGVWEWREGHL